MRQTVLLTGCAGFIGSNFVKSVACRQEVKDHYDFVIVDALTYAGRLSNIQKDLDTEASQVFTNWIFAIQRKCMNSFRNILFSGVSKFCSGVSRRSLHRKSQYFCGDQCTGDFESSEKESLSLFEKNNSFKYLQISTDEVTAHCKMGDPAFTEETPLAPNSPYSASKASADMMCRAFFETHKLPVVITRCSNNYGPLQVEEKFIPLMIKRALANESLPIYGTGMNIRDWIYVDDHNEGAWKVFTDGKAGEVYNLGGNSERQNLDVAKLILKHLGKPESLLSFVQDRKWS